MTLVKDGKADLFRIIRLDIETTAKRFYSRREIVLNSEYIIGKWEFIAKAGEG